MEKGVTRSARFIFRKTGTRVTPREMSQQIFYGLDPEAAQRK